MGVYKKFMDLRSLAQRALLQMDEGVHPETAAVLIFTSPTDVSVTNLIARLPMNLTSVEFTRQNTNQQQLVWIFTASCGFYTFLPRKN
jgi:hypothetical protein